MQEVVKNCCYGGFSISEIATKRYLQLKGKECFIYKQTEHEYKDGKDKYVKVKDNEDNLFVHYYTKDFGDSFEKYPNDKYYFSDHNIPRDDKHLVQVVKELKEEANGKCADLEVCEIPDGVKWEIDEYDGSETIREKHKTW